jgi:adenylosuccinate lyase
MAKRRKGQDDGKQVYEHPLVARNASREMAALFSPQHKFSTWRRLWVALAEAEHELGLKVSKRQIAAMRAVVDDIDFVAAARYEKKLRHDVMAHVHAFADAAPAARPIIHLGATSAYVVDNTDLLILRDALGLIRDWLVNVIDALGNFAKKHRALPALGFTHYQPAQLTTVGKRATLWCYDFVRDLEDVEYRLDTLRFRGLKGATGTQASFLTLFDGDHRKVDRLERLVAKRLGFETVDPVTGQTYSRKVDGQALSVLGGIAASVHKFANDIRLLANRKEIEEPFEKSQIGSSAMAYKRNPMRCERATGLARLVLTLAGSGYQNAAEQWLERTLDDSANKRVTVPEAFLATDGMLKLVLNVASGLVVYPKVIAATIKAELPFMVTEDVLMAAVAAGGDRQALHERIRRHAQAAARRVKLEGAGNDLMDRLSTDDAFAGLEVGKLLATQRYVGRAPQQVDAFLRDVVTQIRRRHRQRLGRVATLSV